jgi:transcriptional regulator with XRE-family HTH domain
MKRKKRPADRPIAKKLSPSEIEKTLSKIGDLIKSKREARTTIEDFVYEIEIAKSAMSRYEKGRDMNLSTFLKVLYGLDVLPETFFKELK